MFDLSRYRGVATALLAVGMALAGCSLLARAAFQERPFWLSEGDSTMEGGQDAVVGRRIAGVLAAQRRHGKSASDLDLGVVLGASAVRMSIEPALLESSGDPRIPTHWLSLYANGANMGDLRGLADLLFGSGLRPRLFLLGMHPGQLARTDQYLSDETTIDAAPFLAALAGRRLRDAKDEFMVFTGVFLNIAFPNRTRISHSSRVLVREAKRRMFARIGLGADSLYTPDPDPWTVQLLKADPEDEDRGLDRKRASSSVREIDEGVLQEGLRGPARDKGWFNAANYETDSLNARSLVAILRNARGRGMETVIVLLPESSESRASVPPEAMKCLTTVLDNAFGSAAPPVINMRDDLTDDMFYDPVHPRREGRFAATRELIKALRSLPLPAQSPPGR